MRLVPAARAFSPMAMAVSILIFGAFMEDAVDFVIEHQFQTVQRQDVTVGFLEATDWTKAG